MLFRKPKPSDDTPREQRFARFRNGALQSSQSLVDDLFNVIPEIWQKLQDLPETNYQLGCRLVEDGNLREAIYRFRFALWLNPKHYLAQYNLGCCYVSLGETENARRCFEKALAIWPEYDEAHFMLATIDPRRRVSQMPPTLVMNHFAMAAPTYDEDNLGQFGYHGHDLVADLVQQYMAADAFGLSILDVGCGSGLVGVRLRSRATRMIGVDLSAEMLALARMKQVEGLAAYDELYESEATVWMAAVPAGQFQAITAAHVVPYMGDVTVLFREAGRVLGQGGVFAFTYEPAKEPGYRLLGGLGRFAHHNDTIAEAAEAAGFEVVSLASVMLFKDYPAAAGVCRKR